MADEGDGKEDKNRHDRKLIELLNELRVALPGVQFLFAFLLTVAFSQRFVDITSNQKKVYYLAVLSRLQPRRFSSRPPRSIASSSARVTRNGL
ncbi:hypothetical protein BH20ACT21_BH20ACT21_11050 [soil metagenome]